MGHQQRIRFKRSRLVEMSEVKKLYNALLSKGYTTQDLGDENTFTTKMSDANNRKELYDWVSSRGDFRLGKYEDYEKRLYTPIQQRDNTPMADRYSVAPEVSDVPQAPSASTADKQEPITTFGGGVKQGAQQLGAGLQYFGGEVADKVSETAADNARALQSIEQMQSEGKDVTKETRLDAKGMLLPLLGHSTDVIGTIAGLFNKDNGFNRAVEEVEVDKLIRKALKETGGDVEAAKALIAKRANEQTVADKWKEKAVAKMNEAKPTEGFAAFAGEMIPQMVGTLAGLGLSAVTKSPLPAQALGLGQMAALTASTAGSSMKEARDAGASTPQVWGAGLADAVVELATEAIPFKRLTRGISANAKRKIGEGIADAMSNPNSPAGKELQNLLTRANKKLGGKLLSGKSAKEFIEQAGIEGMSEFTAEALQTITPMLYEEPENYPTFSEIFNAGLEGFKGGVFMGGILGGASQVATNRTQRDRRKQQGYVDVAEVQLNNGVELVEVLNYDRDNDVVEVIYDNEVVPVQNASQNILRGHRYTYEEFEKGVADGESEIAYEKGRATETPAEKNDAYNRYKAEEENMRNIFSLSADTDVEEYISSLSANPYDFAIKQREKDEEVGQATLDFLNTKAELDGILDRTNDDIDNTIAQSDAIIDSRKSQTDGLIHPATLSIDSRKVYIVSGNVATLDDGTIDTTTSDKAIVIKDATTGKTEFVSANAFASIEPALDPTQEKAVAAENITNTISMQAEKDIEGILPFAIGDTYDVMDDNGVAHTATILANDGQGNVQIRYDNEAEPTSATTSMVQSMADAFKMQQVRGKKASAKVASDSQGNETVTPKAEEVTPTRVVPMQKDGVTPDFNAMDADMFVEEYATRYGEESATKLARKNISSAREEIAKIDKKIDDITDPNQMQNLFDKKAEAEARLNRYVDILDLMGISEDANEAEADQKSKLRNEAGNKIVSLFPDGLPNVESFILADIANGNRIRWSDKETNGAVTSRGLGAELGLSDSNKERVKRLALISNDAMTPEEYAESLRERLDAAGIRYDETALRDDVINTYASVDTRKGAWEALEDIANRANEQEQELMDWEDAQQRIAYEKAKNAVELPAAPDLATMEEEVPVELGASFEENINEIENIFNDERSTENTDVPTSVSAEDTASLAETALPNREEMRRKPLRARAKMWEEKVGVKVNLIETYEDIPTDAAKRAVEEGKRVTGWVVDGQVYLYLPLIANRTEIDKTYLHEVVAHVGMKRLLGKEDYKAFCERVFNEVMTKAKQDYYSVYPGVKDKAMAADEYIAHLAEDANMNTTAWQKIVKIFRDALRKMGIDIRLTNADIEAMLRESYKKLAEQKTNADVKAEGEENVRFSIRGKDALSNLHKASNTIRKWMENGSRGKSFEIELPESVNRQVRQAMGRDFESHNITANGIAHGFKNHGENGLKLTENSIPLRKEDMELIPYIMVAPDRVTKGTTDASGRESVRFYKTISDGYVAVVEKEYKNSVDDMETITMWAEMSPQATNAQSVIAPDTHARNAILSTDIAKIIQDAENAIEKEQNIQFRIEKPSLVGLHNISEEKLRKALKMGGLANPSVAVIDVDKSDHTDYGDYSLVLSKNMVDARLGKNAGTWSGDAWTPTYPQVTKRMSKDKNVSRFYKDIGAMPEAIRGKVRLDFESYMDGRSANALAYWYLFEKGNAPELVNVPARYPEEIVNAINEATNGSFSMYGLPAENRAKCVDAYIAYKYGGDRAAYDAEMDARKKRLENFAKSHEKAFIRKKAQEDLDAINEYGFDYDEVSRFIHDVEWDVRHKGEVDADATIKASMDYITENNLGAEYDAWRDNLDERYGIKEYIFDGYTNSGTPRYLPHTIENASKWMKKQGRQGAVATFPSFGTFVAVSIPKMTTLDSIRKRKNSLGKSKEEYDAFREKWENVYYELGKKLQPDAKGFDDYGYWRLIEAVGQRNPKEYIKKQYNIELSKEDMNTLNEMLDAIRNEYPARYFETKFERPINIREFVGAVVPENIPSDIEAELLKAGLNIYKYDPQKEGSRREATLDAVDSDNIRFRIVEPAPTFYSNAERAAENVKQEKATPEQWLKMIEKNGGLKAGEDKWLGLSDWLKSSDKKTLTKQEVLDFIKENQIQIEEVEYGDGIFSRNSKINLESELQAALENGRTIESALSRWDNEFGDNKLALYERGFFTVDKKGKIHTDEPVLNHINSTRLKYTTYGLENKREIALTVPTIESWNASDQVHFGDAGNGRAIAWVRFGETTDADGNRVLVIDEVQSKRHQEGREKGYRENYIKNEFDLYLETLTAKYGQNWVFDDLSEADQQKLMSYSNRADVFKEKGVPSAPFEKNWAELAMKRMLRYAAENGFDKIAWTTGEQQAERYSLGAVMQGLKAYKTSPNTYYVIPYNNGAIGEFVKEYTEKELAETFGKEIAVNIITNAENATEENPYEMTGDDLRIGGSGMKAFYDQMIPSFMNKYGKKWGVKVGEVTMPSLEENNTMHSIDVTDAMRESVMQGQPMFRISDYDRQFDALQSEYDALDKNDAKALNEWREKKTSAVRDYLTHIKDRFGMRSELIVFNGADESQLQDAYQRLVDAYNANGNSNPPTYEEFKKHSLKADVVATYRKGGKVITFNATSNDVRVKEQFAESLFHENAHRASYELYNDEEFKAIWDAVKGSNNYIAQVVEKKYNDRSDVQKGKEVVAKAIGYLSREYKGLFLQFMNGKISTDALVEKLHIRSKIANLAIEETLNILKDEYTIQVSRRGNARKLGGVGYGRGLRDSRMVSRKDEGIEQERERGGVRGGSRGGFVLESFLNDVAQKGLREMVGGQRYNDFLMRALRDANEPTRRQIVNEAMRNGLDFLSATNNYLASLAEQDNVDEAYLGRVKNYLTRILADAGVDAEGLSNDELRYILWKNNQKDNGVFSLAEDVVMRNKLGVGNYTQEADTSFRVADITYGNFYDYTKATFNEVEKPAREADYTSNSGSQYWYGEDKNGQYVVRGSNHWSGIGRDQEDLDRGRTFAERNGRNTLIGSCQWELISNKTSKELRDSYPNPIYGKVYLKDMKPRFDNNQTDAPSNEREQIIADANNDDIRYRVAPSTPSTGEARRLYEKAVRRHTREKDVKKSENLWHQLREAYQDSMLSVKALQDAILAETGNKLQDYEDVYTAENQLSSRNQAEIEKWERDFMRPLQEQILALINKGASYSDIVEYLLAKHGLERNVVIPMRDAEAIAERWEKKRLDGADKAYKYEKKRIDGSYGGQRAALRKNLDTGILTQEQYTNAVSKLDKAHDKALKQLERKYEKLVERIKDSRSEMYEKAWTKLRGDDYSGLTELTGEAKAFTEAAQKMVDMFEKRYNTNDLWARINAATKESLRKTFNSGLMNKETFDKVSSMFEYYIPLRGWDNNVAADLYDYMGNKGMKIMPALKTAKGRTSRADDPIATLGSVGESSIIQGNRNLMKQKLLNLAQGNPTSLLTVNEQWYVKQADGTWKMDSPIIPIGATGEEVDKIIKDHEAKMLSLGENATKSRKGLEIDLHTTQSEEEEHAVSVKRNGKEYKVYVNGNPIAAQAINGFTNPNANKKDSWEWLEQKAMWVKNFMARAFTSRNPAFIFVNLARDLMWSGTSLSIKEGAKYNKQYAKNIASAFGKNNLPSLISKWEKGTLNMDNPVERYFSEFITNGGETGHTQLNTVDDYKRNIEQFIKEAQGGAVSNSKKAWRWIWDNVEFLNRSAEDTTRFTVYMTSRQMGRSITESVANAKDVTVNFNRKGRGTFGANVLGFAYIFFNASIQSLANFGKLVANHPKKTTAALTTFASSGMIAPLVALTLQSLVGDDDEPTYWDLPEWVRRNNIVLYVGGSGYVTIPLPHELRPFYGMGELAFSVLNGKEEVDEALKKSAEGFASLLPLDYTSNAGNVIVNITPTIAQPMAQLVVNKDFFGTPIYRKTAFNEKDPEWTKAYKSTNQTLVDATEFVNELTGGDAVKSGVIDLNPAIIEHIFESYFGGMGKTINRTAKTFSMLWNEDMREWRNVPVLSSFYTESNERTSGSQLNREYYDAVDEAEDVEHLYSGYNKQAKMGSMEYAEKLNELMESPIFKRYQIVKGYKNAISKLSTQLKEAGLDEMDELETLIMNLKVEMLEELEELESNNK